LTIEELAPGTLGFRFVDTSECRRSPAGGKMLRGDIYRVRSAGVRVHRVAVIKNLQIPVWSRTAGAETRSHGSVCAGSGATL
jgi:hypothetical protein